MTYKKNKLLIYSTEMTFKLVLTAQPMNIEGLGSAG